MNISKEAKVGFVGLLILFSSIFLFDRLRRSNVFSTNLIITAQFEDLEFLKKGNPVLIKGKPYGYVTAIYKDNNRLLVDMDIEPGTMIPSTAKAVIAEMSLLGGRTISITYEGSCTANCLESGAIIPGEVGNLKSQVENAVGPMLKSFGNVVDTLMGPNGMSPMLAKAYEAAAGLAKSTKSFENKMAGMNKTLPTTIKNFKDLTASLLNTEPSLKNALSGTVTDKNMGLALDSLVNNLSSLSQEDIDAMTQILYTLRDNAKTLPEKIDKGKAAIAKGDAALDKLIKKVEPFQEGSSGKIANLLYNADYKDSLSNKIQNMSQKIRDIKEHPEKHLSLKKQK